MKMIFQLYPSPGKGNHILIDETIFNDFSSMPFLKST